MSHHECTILSILNRKPVAGDMRLLFNSIKGEMVTENTGIQFVSRCKKAMGYLGMETISIQEYCYLRPAQFRHNIVSDTNGICYVDIQNFVLADRRFGDKLLLTMQQRKLRNRRKSEKTWIASANNSVNLTELFRGCVINIKEIACIDFITEDESKAIEALAARYTWNILRYLKTICLL